MQELGVFPGPPRNLQSRQVESNIDKAPKIMFLKFDKIEDWSRGEKPACQQHHATTIRACAFAVPSSYLQVYSWGGPSTGLTESLPVTEGLLRVSSYINI